MKASIILRAYLMSEDTRKCAMKNKFSPTSAGCFSHEYVDKAAGRTGMLRMPVMREVPQHVMVLHSNFLIFCTKQQSTESLISDTDLRPMSEAGFALEDVFTKTSQKMLALALDECQQRCYIVSRTEETG